MVIFNDFLINIFDPYSGVARKLHAATPNNPFALSKNFTSAQNPGPWQPMGTFGRSADHPSFLHIDENMAAGSPFIFDSLPAIFTILLKIFLEFFAKIWGKSVLCIWWCSRAEPPGRWRNFHNFLLKTNENYDFRPIFQSFNENFVKMPRIYGENLGKIYKYSVIGGSGA